MNQEQSFFDLDDEKPKSRTPSRGVPLSTPARPVSKKPKPQQSSKPATGRPAPRKPAPAQQPPPVASAPLPQRSSPQRSSPAPLPSPSRAPSHSATSLPATPAPAPHPVTPAQAPIPAPVPQSPEPDYYHNAPTSPPVRRQPIHEPVYESDEDDDFIEEYPQKPKKKKPAPKKKTPVKRKAKDKVDKGGKTKASMIRGIALTLITILCGYGIYTIINPPQFPSQQQVLHSVQQGMGVTNFPADRAHSFVISFTEAYLTVDQGNREGRAADLGNYVPERILSEMSTSTGTEEQSIVAGPFISGTRYVSDEDAVFTVSSRVDNGNWIYLEVPVYHNADERSFAISGAPAIVSAPRLSEVPRTDREWRSDDAAADEMSEELERFFTTWASGDSDEIRRIAPNGDARVIAGIEGVTFRSISDLEVSPPIDPENPQSMRNVLVTVNWYMNTATGDSPTEDDRPIQYSMRYELMVYKSTDPEQWMVRDIRGGVRSADGSGQSGTSEEEEE